MSQPIRVKRSAVPGKVPTISDLALGELAVNTYDGKLYTKRNNGTESVVDLSGSAAAPAGSLYNVQINGGPSLDAIPNGTSGHVLTSNGNATPTWEPVPVSGGTVREVDATGGDTGLVFTGGPITETGLLTLDGTLNVASGGTGVTTQQGIINIVVPSQTGNASRMLTTNGTTLSWAVPPGATYTGSSTIDVSGTVISATVADNTGLSNLVQLSTGAGKVVGIANGTAGQVLRAQGGSLPPVWDSAGGTVTSVAVSGGTTGLTTSGGPITANGTITLAGTLNVASGGTGQTTVLGAFNALSPATTRGDLITRNATNNIRLPIGPSGYVLSSDGTDVVWSTVAAGTVTSIAVSGGTTGLTTTGGPITSNGTITLAGTLAIANGGTGQITASAGFNALSPATTRGDIIVRDATGNVRLPIGANGYVLASNGTDVVWSTVAAGTVTSIAVSGGTTGLTTSGGPITSNGTITLAGTLAITNGGTGQTTAAASFNALSPTTAEGDIIVRGASTNARLPIGANGTVLTSNGTTATWTTTGAGSVTSVQASGGTTGLSFAGGPITSSGTLTLAGTLTIANGGTGQTSAAAAINALVPTQTGNTGRILTTNGTSVSWGDAGSGSVTSVQMSGGTSGLSYTGGPITGAGTITTTGVLNIANGGTGATSAQAARNALLPDQTSHAGQILVTDGTNVTWSSAAGSGTVTSVAISGGTTGLTTTGGPITTNGTITLAGTLAITNGGTGQTSAAAAINALVPTQTGNSGQFLTTNGTAVAWSAVTGFASLSTANTFTRAQAVTPSALTDGATIATDASLSNNFRVVLAGNRTLANPTNLVGGQIVNFVVVQDGTGNKTLSYGSMFKWPNASAPVLSTGANAVDIISCIYDATGTALYCNINKNFA